MVVLVFKSIIFAIVSLNLIACSTDQQVLTIAGIPDQNASQLARRYLVLTDYLEEQLSVQVRYLPTIDYAATVLAFTQGDVQLAWFGGLSGVQARLAVPGSEAIGQRERDRHFHTKFIANRKVDVRSIEDLKGLKFAFGSESSTSGHLMPRHVLLRAGINPETYFDGPPVFSGSHDKTYIMVESGTVHAGALSEVVWQEAVESGRVDTARAYEFYTTEEYFDYNWTVRYDVDDVFGEGFKTKLTDAIINIKERDILDLFAAERFTDSNNSNYSDIKAIAESIGIIK